VVARAAAASERHHVISPMAVTTQEAKRLLMSPELRAVEEAVAAQVGLPLLREDGRSEVVAIEQIVTNVSEYTLFTLEDVLERLRSDRELLIRFWIAFHRDCHANPPAQEYPVGEEPDPDDVPQPGKVLGLVSGFGVILVVWLHFLREREKPQLAGYLKDRRTPHAAKYAANLQKIYESVAEPAKAR
jgi:hypothetical protein